MPKNREKRRESECGTKRQHDDKRGATAHMRRLVDRFPAEEWTCYRCPFCGFWHVGHRNRPKRKRKQW